MNIQHKNWDTQFFVEKETVYTYIFNNFFHPFVGKLTERSRKKGIEAVLRADTEIDEEKFFNQTYDKNPEDRDDIKIKSYPKEIVLEPGRPYAVYNWEIFYHIPLSIAVQLSKNQRFEDAQKWFHFIFDPTTDEPVDSKNSVKRYWKFKYFREHGDLNSITERLKTLSASGGDEEKKEKIKNNIEEWRKNPFRPHVVAQARPLAYKYNVIMKYLDNLIDWGDSLFRQFTIESINQATQIYVLASSILGERPQEVPDLYERPVRNYKNIKDDLDKFSNAWVNMENEFPLNSNIPQNVSSSSSRSKSLTGIGQQLYFCVPENEELLKYWDTVADRLYKIRHCMDIEGNVRSLSLFQPPIDPGMLVKAAAAGLDLSSVAAGLNQPVSNVRFRVIYQKALDLCNELRSMGQSFLSAQEKGDSEKLTQLRQEHELKMNELVSDIKYLRWKEAEASTEALLKSRKSAYENYSHYQRLLGKEESDYSNLEQVSLNRQEITEDNFDQVYGSLVEQYGVTIDQEEYKEEKLGLLGEATSNVEGVDAISKAVGIGGSNHLKLNELEDIELNIFMPASTALNVISAATSGISAPLRLIPQNLLYAAPLGVGYAGSFGGEQASGASEIISKIFRISSEIASYAARRAGKLGQYTRRINRWVHQNNMAAVELEQLGRRIISSLINEQALKRDYDNHQVQIEQSKAVEEYIKHEKFTNEDLYLWMQGELSKIYYDCYKLAFDTAKKAEATLKQELMRKELDEKTFIKFNYWDAGKKGLLSGDALLLDLKRMDLAYIESNKREYELTKHISLKRLHPQALLQLKATGSCKFNLPEWLYDLDCPGHYMRRIKSVSLSVPCVTGPYTSVNCTLSLQKSSIRTSSLLSNNQYGRKEDENDDRFKDYFGAVDSIVTSNAQNDSGMFQVNFEDERYLPFENVGAISTWQLELPSKLRQFDYHTITDVILHVKYTSRQGGERLAKAAENWIGENPGEIRTAQLLSLKHDFPNEWHRFTSSQEGHLKITVTKDHLPYLVSAKDIKVDTENTELYEISNQKLISISNWSKRELTGELTGGFDVIINRDSINRKDDVFLLFAYFAES